MRAVVAGGIGAVVGLLLASAARAQMTVDLTLDQRVYILGEAVRADVRIVNHSTTPFMVGPGGYSQNGLTFSVVNNGEAVDTSQAHVPMIPELALKGGDTYLSAYELDEWYPMGKTGSYLVTALVRRDDRRYESPVRSIDIVPGLEIKTAIQLFADRPDFERKLTLVYFMRKQTEYLFLRVTDTPGDRTWTTLELGQLLRTTPPTIEISADGVVTVFHRATRDVHLKTRVKSTADGVELLGQERIVDPHTEEIMQAQKIRAMEAEEKKKKEESHWWWPFGGSSDSKTEK